MANQGVQATESVHFSVYAGACRSGGPWQYTVGPCNSATHTDGQVVEDYLNVGSGYGNGLHDLTVVGPDRFLRRFTGNAHGPAEGHRGRLLLRRSADHRQAGGPVPHDRPEPGGRHLHHHVRQLPR